MLADALRIAWFDLKLMLRQKETLLWTFLMPPIFFYFIGTVTAGFGGGGASQDALAVRVAPDAGFLADALLARLAEQDLRIVRPDEAPDAEDGDAPAPFEDHERRLEVPAGFTAGVLACEPQEVLYRHAGDGLRDHFVALRVRRAVYTTLADVVAAANAKDELTAESVAALRSAPRALALTVAPAGRRKEVPTGFAQAVPGTMVMFAMIILLTSGASTLIVERREGLLRRLASAPIRRGAVVLGKWGGRLALGAVQLAFAMTLGAVAFGVAWGPELPMLCVVLLAYAGLLAALALLLGNLARTEGQAIGLSVLATNVLAALGGCWWPIEVTPEPMQRLALFLPTGWAMDAVHKLASFGAPAASALPHVVGMALLALLLGQVAARTFRFV
jgi:ABC-type Na+ efflux pump permease subunit